MHVPFLDPYLHFYSSLYMYLILRIARKVELHHSADIIVAFLYFHSVALCIISYPRTGKCEDFMLEVDE